MSKYSKPKETKLPISINRTILFTYLNRKINFAVSLMHVKSIITILFDEISKELCKGNKVKIGNFGEFHLKQMPDRTYYNLFEKKKKFAKGLKILRFVLDEEIKEELMTFLDVDKTLGAS